MKLTEMFKKCHAIFASEFGMPEEIDIEVQLCKDREELYIKRIVQTANSAARENILKKKDRYIKAEGCFIVPPKKPNYYTILITQKDGNELYDTYKYMHELSHVCNHYAYMQETKQGNPFASVENMDFYLWDEFRARYTSTIVILRFLQGIACEKELQKFQDTVVKVLRNTLGTQCIATYDGSQYLGFIAAVRDLNIITDEQLNGYFQSQDEKSTYYSYISCKDVPSFLQLKE